MILNVTNEECLYYKYFYKYLDLNAVAVLLLCKNAWIENLLSIYA